MWVIRTAANNCKNKRTESNLIRVEGGKINTTYLFILISGGGKFKVRVNYDEYVRAFGTN